MISSVPLAQQLPPPVLPNQANMRQYMDPGFSLTGTGPLPNHSYAPPYPTSQATTSQSQAGPSTRKPGTTTLDNYVYWPSTNGFNQAPLYTLDPIQNRNHIPPQSSTNHYHHLQYQNRSNSVPSIQPLRHPNPPGLVYGNQHLISLPQHPGMMSQEVIGEMMVAPDQHNAVMAPNQENGLKQNQKVPQTRNQMSPAQHAILEAAYQEDPRPSASFKRTLAKELGMPEQPVFTWFQNRRAKQKSDLRNCRTVLQPVLRALGLKQQQAALSVSTTTPQQQQLANGSPAHGSAFPLPQSGSASVASISPEWLVTNLPTEGEAMYSGGSWDTFPQTSAPMVYPSDRVTSHPPSADFNSQQQMHQQQQSAMNIAGATIEQQHMMPGGQLGLPYMTQQHIPYNGVPQMVQEPPTYPTFDGHLGIHGMQQQPSINPGYQYGYTTGPGMGAVSLPPRAGGRRSSIANGEAANISKMIQKRRGMVVGAANAARRGSTPYPVVINTSVIPPPSSASPQQARAAKRRTSIRVSSPTPESPSAIGASSQRLLNNRRSSMPVIDGSHGSTPSLLRQSQFVPPRIVSGNALASLAPSHGRVTRELSPDHGDSEVGISNAHPMTCPGLGHNDPLANFNNIHDRGDEQFNSTSSGMLNQNGSYTHYTQNQTFIPNGQVHGLGLGHGNGAGPLPNPSFTFGDVHNEPSAMSVPPGMDELYYQTMQDRSRVDSMASLATHVSEAPTETSDYGYVNGYLNAHNYDMSRRSSAPAGLVEGLGMIGLSPSQGIGGPGNQPMRPSPLGQNHSISSNQVHTASMAPSPSYGYGYNNGNHQYETGPALGSGYPTSNPNSNGSTPLYGYDASPHRYSSQGHNSSTNTAITSPVDMMRSSTGQSQQQWLHNPNVNHQPMTSSRSSGSTDQMYGSSGHSDQSFPGLDQPCQPNGMPQQAQAQNVQNQTLSQSQSQPQLSVDTAVLNGNANGNVTSINDYDFEWISRQSPDVFNSLMLGIMTPNMFSTNPMTAPPVLSNNPLSGNSVLPIPHDMIPPVPQSNVGYTLPGHNGNDFLPTLGYNDRVIEEGEEEDDVLKDEFDFSFLQPQTQSQPQSQTQTPTFGHGSAGGGDADGVRV